MQVSTIALCRDLYWVTSSQSQEPRKIIFIFCYVHILKTFQLFDFKDLKGFSLTLTAGFYESHIDMFPNGRSWFTFFILTKLRSHSAEDQPVFVKIWDMLMFRCPQLEELTIDGLSAVPTDIHLLVRGRWPALKKLALGDICIDWFPRSRNPAEKRPFVAFLEAHPHLESLSLSRHSIQATHFSLLDPTSLNSLTSFSGTYQQLQALPHIHHLIKSLTLCDPVETREVSATSVAVILRELTSLTSLKIAFMLHSMYDSGNLLRSLSHSCPMLHHLDLTCGHKPSFQLVRNFYFIISLFIF
jgi:hypothetical protein